MLFRAELGIRTAIVAPQSYLEIAVTDAFKETFDLDAVGVDDNFFDLGGDSISAEALALDIFQKTSRDFEVSWLINHSTPRAIAERLVQIDHAVDSAARPPIFIVHGKTGVALPGKHFLAGFHREQPLHFFELPGIRGQGETPSSVAAVASLYVAQLTKALPEGPIILAGSCTGCLIALEMAIQLQASQRPVERLVMMDPAIPNSRRRGRWETDERRKRKKAKKEQKGRWWKLLHKLGLLRRTPVKVIKPKSEFEISEAARATIHNAYKTYDLKPYPAAVAIVATQQRADDFESRQGLWEELLPSRKVIRIDTATHRELYHGDRAKETSAVVQRIADEALGAVSFG